MEEDFQSFKNDYFAGNSSNTWKEFQMYIPASISQLKANQRNTGYRKNTIVVVQ